MHINSSICKYNLNGKCKFGSNCSYLHIQRTQMDRALGELYKLRAENKCLKSDLMQKVDLIIKLKSLQTKDEFHEVHALQKEHYSSFFKNDPPSKKEKIKLNHSGIGTSELIGQHLDNKSSNIHRNGSLITQSNLHSNEKISRIDRERNHQDNDHIKSKTCPTKKKEFYEMNFEIIKAIDTGNSTTSSKYQIIYPRNNRIFADFKTKNNYSSNVNSITNQTNLLEKCKNLIGESEQRLLTKQSEYEKCNERRFQTLSQEARHTRTDVSSILSIVQSL